MTKIIGAPTLDDALSALGSVAAANEARGERTIVFCEDRLTLLAERAVLPAGGTFLTEVTSFARFLRSDTRVLSKHGSILEFSSLLASLKEELVCFGASAAQAVYETVAQLFASRVAPAMLRESAERAEGVLRFKLLDLALLYEKYEEFLSERGLLDENGYLALLPERLGAAVAEVNVVFFAFTSFTRQAQEGIRAAIGNARSVAGIFLAGRSAYYTNEAARVFRSVAEEFEKPEIRQLKSSLEGEAALLQAHLFSPDAPSERAPARSVFGFSAADEAEEMNTVAAIIRKKTAEGMRYRDFSVLVGDKSYFLPALKAFKAHGIPFYADKKRAYAEHPFCAFALSALEAVSSPEAADDVAASVYFGDGGEYRNYLIKLVGRGAVRREIPQDIPAPLRGKLEACRQKMLSILALFRPKDRGAAYADGVAKLYELVDGENVTSALQKAVGGEEAAFLETKRLWDILEETKEIVGERTFTAREFSALLKSGLEGAEVSMLPRSRDAVFVGDITESRVARCPVVFAAGLTDEVPRVCHDTAVITDREIGRLKELRVEIEPAIAVVNARAKEAPALNLCAFTQELYLSCPARKGGAECAPSEILSLVRQLFTLQELPPLFPYTCTRYGPALLAYFEGCDEAEGWKTSQNAERLAAECSTLREALKGGVFGHGAIVDPEEVRRREKPAVSEAGELYFGRAVSPTLLEDWFECPYKSFAMRALRVSEQDERALLGSADAGTFVHTVLERTAKRFHEFSGEEECRAHTSRRNCSAGRHSPLLRVRRRERTPRAVSKRRRRRSPSPHTASSSARIFACGRQRRRSNFRS